MKYILVFLFLILFFTLPTYASYCVYDCENELILEGDEVNQVQSVASISKIMTAIIVLDHASLYESVIISSTMIEEEGSSIYMKEGDVYSVEALLYGLLLRSGNDAARALALYISDYDLDLFVSWMNNKAKQIGMYHTYFENPSGLEQPYGNQSTSYDMAKLMCYASKYDELLKIMQTTSYQYQNKEIWNNKNRLLSLNEWIIGGKTGFTKKAGRTLLSLAQNPNKISIASFRIPNDFKFHDALFRKWYNENPMIKLFSKGIYLIDDKQFIVEDDEYIPLNDFNSSLIKINLSNDFIVIEYNDLIWKYEIISGTES